MSLLLDALQRASEEKEKLAEARASEEKRESKAEQHDHSPLPVIVDDAELVQSMPMGNEDRTEHESLPDLEFPAHASSPASDEPRTIPGIEEKAPAISPEQPTPAPVSGNELALELSPQLSPAPPPAVEHTHVLSPAEKAPTIPAVETSSRNTPQGRTEPVIESTNSDTRYQPPGSKPANPAAPKINPVRTPSGPVLSAQVAQDILGATAKPHKINKRRLVIAFATGLLLAVAAGSFFVLGLFNKTPEPGPVFNPNAPKDVSAPAAESASAPTSDSPVAVGTNATSTSAKPDAGTNTTVPAAPARAKAVDTKSAGAMAEGDDGISRNAISNDGAKNVGAKPSRQRQADNAAPVFISTPTAASSSSLDVAYAALKEGRYDDAVTGYKLALTRNSGEVDALLGLAYIAQRQGHNAEARSYYSEVLRQNPGHPAATAGLLSIASEGDLQSATSRAGDMAQRNPDSAIAMSTLGNLLAKQGRIAEAQQAYFRAFTLESTNPLHAFNLAVALDRLHKYPQALQYYKRAVALSDNAADSQPTAFSRNAALQRMQQLEASAGTAGDQPSSVAK